MMLSLRSSSMINILQKSTFDSLTRCISILTPSRFSSYITSPSLLSSRTPELNKCFESSNGGFNNTLLKSNTKGFQQQKRSYAMRLELTEYGIIWRRPEPVPVWKPEKSGDLIPHEEIDKTRPTLDYLPIENEVKKADKRAQELLSIAFSSEREALRMAKHLMKRRIQQHQLDDDSLEVQIACLTVEIRYFQKLVSEAKSQKKIMHRRIRLQEKIESRRKKLVILRRHDYKKFEWLLEELGLFYKPLPKVKEPVTRRGSLRKLVQMYAKSVREQRLEKYRLELETMKKPFLEEKRKTLQWIAETEERLGLPISVEVPSKETDETQLAIEAKSNTEILKPKTQS